MKDIVPANLGGTNDAAPPYEKKGFKAVEKPPMILAGTSEDGALVVYEETCFIYRPSVSASATNDPFHPLHSKEA